MKRRLGWLFGAGLLALALAVWRGALAPSPGAGQGASNGGTRTGPWRAEGGDYALADDEVIRHIPVPDPGARRRLLGESRPGEVPLASLTVVWDGRPRIRRLEIGYEVIPRRLLRVLVDSLGVPLYRLKGIEVARGIGLSGDWVVRAGADLELCMAYLEEVVQRSGYPAFRIVDTLEKRRALDMRGLARAPERPIVIFQPHRDASPAQEQTGTLLAFGEALSRAIQRPVSVHAQPQDLKVSWQDNSSAYLDLGPDISREMVANLLNEVSRALGVTFTEREVEMRVWRLELRH